MTVRVSMTLVLLILAGNMPGCNGPKESQWDLGTVIDVDLKQLDGSAWNTDLLEVRSEDHSGRELDLVSSFCLDEHCDDNNQCTEDSCDPLTGECRYEPVEVTCDDENFCTHADTCVKGVCLGQPVSCDDSNPCTMDSCDVSGGCLYQHLDNFPCDDGNFCTVDDLCAQGTCTGLPRNCSDGNLCTLDFCDVSKKACDTAPVSDGISCEDGNSCTVADTCQAGGCQSGSEAKFCQDGNPCTNDLCFPGKGCQFPANSLPCDDGNPCTTGDKCISGTCHPGFVKNCSDGNSCTLDSCLAATGECHHTAVDWPCNDGNLCTIDDLCSEALCQGTPVVCNDGNPCTADSCEPEFGCAYQFLSVPCDDGNSCSIGDLCAQGICVPGSIKPICDDGNECTDDSCDPTTGLCYFTANNASCDDGNPCTQDDLCIDSNCLSGDTGVCECETDGDCLPFDDGDLCNGTLICHKKQWPYTCQIHPSSVITCPHNMDTDCITSVCKPETGMCVLTPLAGGTPCDDGNPCTLSDSCDDGECLPVIYIDCDDDNPCTDEECAPGEGCTYSANNQPCDDGVICTLSDKCMGGNCVGIGVVCDDGNACSTGYCDPETGDCEFVATFGSCDDGNPCTLTDHCEALACIGNPVDCDDGQPCTADACQPEFGCLHEPVLGECDDGNGCTVNDNCQDGLCKGTGITCLDTNPCTDDLCLPDLGCHHPPNVAPCDDEDACTYGDQCQNGECVGLVVTCEDGNPCTTKSCHKEAGCIISWLDVACEDFNSCTLGDWCVGGKCTPGSPIYCNDGNVCTLDMCNPETGQCEYKFHGLPCDDGNNCSTNDLCIEGVCTGFPVNCEDFNSCTVESCKEGEGCFYEPLTGPYCKDNDACSTLETCESGVCVGHAEINCDDGNVCTEDGCSPDQGCVHDPIQGIGCDDDDDTTVWDLCVDGSCAGLPDDDGDSFPDVGSAPVCVGGSVEQCRDNCPGLENPIQADADGDGVGDDCEVCGTLHVFDGISPPQEDSWLATAENACPDNLVVKGAGLDEDEPYLSFKGVREPACGPYPMRVYVAQVMDLSDENRVLEVDLEWETGVYPFAFLGTHLAEIGMTNGVDHLILTTMEASKTDGDCGETAVVTPFFARAVWRVEVLPSKQTASLFFNGEEVEESPISLVSLDAPWHLYFKALAADLAGNCGASAAIRFYSFASLCEWEDQ